MPRTSDHLLLRFVGATVEAHSVPAVELARALDGFQRIVHLIGMRLEGRTLSRRARPSQEVQRRFLLVCDLPRPGSYEQPIRLVTRDPQLLAPQELEKAEIDLSRFLSAVGRKDERELEEAVADPTYRRFMLDALAQAMPDPQSGVALDVSAAGRQLLHSTTSIGFIEDQRRPRHSAASAGVVNGELIEIDFASRRITLRLLGTKRDIACSYEDSVEPTLLEHPRELIQVFGSVSLDSRGAPRTIEAVDFIRPIQESEDISIASFNVGSSLVRAREPLEVKIRFDREEQVFFATIASLEIETAGETRDDVAEGVVAELKVLWRNYACAADERLTAGARRLKGELLDAFKEEPHAA